ncbi:hypothetical protein JCM6882_005167 [Rhodosporidiobolus microsporus]
MDTQPLNAALNTTVSAAPPSAEQETINSLVARLSFDTFDSVTDNLLALMESHQDTAGAPVVYDVVHALTKAAVEGDEKQADGCARTCRKFTERLASTVHDPEIKSASGELVTGGALFRKVLLNHLQVLYDEGPISLGYSRFCAHLFVLGLLVERIMHELVKKHLVATENVSDETVLALCALLHVAGKKMDTAKAHQHMKVYLSRMGSIVKRPETSKRARFEILTLIDRRTSRWLPLSTSHPLAAVYNPVESSSRSKGSAKC